MRKKLTWLIVSAVAIALVLFALVQRQGQPTESSLATASPQASAQAAQGEPLSSIAPHVPAHFETAPSSDSLGATLNPTKFFGKTKQAYEVARKIPLTLAQLPCYCHCDKSVGHKSLHSCFEDEHAASCAVCVDEALLAYQLEKSGKTASQIREQIVAQYSVTTH